MSEDESRPCKRARVDDKDCDANAPADSADIQRDEDVWFLDGNIVLIANKTVACRVYKGVLSLRSELFRDMFSLPKVTAAATETFDGCPTFEVDDSPEDIRHLFLVICCGKNYYYDRDTLLSVPFDVLASLIRMAHKYMVQDVLDEALCRLKNVTTETDDAPTVIQLARLTDTPSLLPTAFLTCVELSTKYHVAPDGSVAYPAAVLAYPDLARVIAGKGSLTQAVGTRTLVLLGSIPSARCTTREACGLAREEPLVAFREDGWGAPISDDGAFEPIAERLWGEPHWGAFCRGCRQALVKADAKEMKELWGDLPGQFGLVLDENSWPKI